MASSGDEPLVGEQEERKLCAGRMCKFIHVYVCLHVILRFRHFVVGVGAVCGTIE